MELSELTKGLQAAGLSVLEADAYLAILQHGPISAGQIAKQTHNYRPNVYQAIEKLKGKGFISESHGKRSKLYECLSADHLVAEFDKKRGSVALTVAALKRMKRTSQSATTLRMIEGVNGWRHLLNEFMEMGEERVVYGVPKIAIDHSADFFEVYHKKRAQRKLSLRHLYNFDARDRMKITNKLPCTHSRYLPKELDQPVSTSVCGSLVAITTYDPGQVLTIVIDNPMVAQAYRTYFEFLWKQGKE